MDDQWDEVDKAQLPNFLIIGAMKSGTTSLHRLLAQHPEVYMPEFKEPGLFLEYPAYLKKAQDQLGMTFKSRQQLLTYLREGYRGEKCFGESSTYYTKIPAQGNEAPMNIRTHAPGMKMIYLLRNPYGRMVSHFRYVQSMGAVQGVEFNDFLRQAAPLLVRISSYQFQLSHYLELFPPQQFLILTLEKLQQQPSQVMGEICEFLEIDAAFDFQDMDKAYNATSEQNSPVEARPRFDEAIFDSLSTVIERDVQALRGMTGYRFDEWDMNKDSWCR